MEEGKSQVSKKLALGLMSGTSADGLSLALAEFEQRTFKLHAYTTVSYPTPLVKRILSASNLRTPQLSQLNFELGHFFADQTATFLKKTQTAPKSVAVIGSHGQTVYHGPNDKPANTLQIGEPALIAQKTGIPVVADFRPGDIAAGGSGAPLIPFFDDYFFSEKQGRALQNIGGIANVTFLKKGRTPVAFDNGPGNALMDLAMLKISNGKKTFDKNGQLARKGAILPSVLKQLQRHRYFKKEPPKSTGRELFNTSFLPANLWREKPEDVLATLTYFTAWAIADSYFAFIPFELGEVLVSGGGALNPVLMEHLKNLLYPADVRSMEELKIPSQAKEPIAFAFLALRAIQGKVNHLPQTTGAKHTCILGKIIHGNKKSK